jgi:hypothetical protein
MKTMFALGLLLVGSCLHGACSSSSPNIDIQRECALNSACLGNGIFSYGSGCELLAMVNAEAENIGTPEAKLVRPTLDCIAQAADCKSRQACSGATAAQAAACGASKGNICDGNVLLECGGSTVNAEDCGSVGLVCGATGGSGSCGTGFCSPMSSTPHCDGDDLVSCADFGGVWQPRSCKGLQASVCTGGKCSAQVAETCGVVNGTPQCVGTGAACDDATFANTCDGTVIVGCAGGRTGRFDCASYGLGLGCIIGKDGAAVCAIGTQCDDTTAETCADGVITYCMFGIKTTVDCKSYGLSGCAVSTGLFAGASCTI